MDINNIEITGIKFVSLKELHIKNCYDSDSDDILNSFYIPALSASIKHQRKTGLIIAQDNLELMTPRELEEYEKALESKESD